MTNDLKQNKNEKKTTHNGTIRRFIKAFTHYFSQLGTGKKIGFYDLRKTYVSHLFASYGDKARIITKHSGMDVMFNHYIDQEVVSQVASDFEFFDL